MKHPATPAALLAVGTLCLSALLAGCGEKPEALLGSARQYLAKNDTKAAIIQIKNALQADPNLPEARLMLGRALLDGGDAVGAETELRKALALKAPDDAVLPPLARAMLAQGYAKKLTDELGKVQLKEPAAQADLQVSLAAAYGLLNQGEHADSVLQAALHDNPDYPPALLQQARKLAGKGDYAQALSLLDRVTAKAPDNMEAWKLKGDMVARQPDHTDDAQAAYRKALALKPDHLPTRTALLMTMLQKHDLDGAARELAPLQKLAPNHPNTQYLEALLAYHKQDFKGALALAQQSLSTVPGNAAVLQLAGASALQLRQLPQARDYLVKVVEAAPDMALARRLLVITYMRLREPALALQALQPALQQVASEPALAELAGEVYLRNGQLDQADAYFKQARLQKPNDGRLRTSQVLVKMLRNPAGNAADELQDISASDSGTTADMALITAHIQRREFDQALKAIAVLEKKQAGQPMAPYLRARVQLAMNDRAAARSSLERAVAQDASYFPALAALAALDMADKHPQDARKRFDALLKRDPKNVPALLALADLSAASGASTEEVAKLLGNAVAANPNDVSARLQLVDWYLRKQEAKKAVAAAQSAAAALPTEPRILDALGRSQQAAGDSNQALATFGKLAELMPQSPLPAWRTANVQLANRDQEGAIQSLRRAITLQPEFLEGQRALVGLYMNDKRQDEAQALARKMQTQRPKEDVGYVTEADIQAAGKNWDKAAAVLRSGQKQANSTLLSIKLHTVLLAAGKRPEADQLAQQWQKEHPKDIAFVFYLGDKALERKDLNAAEQYYTTVLKQQPDNALALNNLAWVSGQLKRDNAIGYAERANTLMPEQPSFMDTLATLRADKGEFAKALELQNRALALQPQNALLKLNLAKIQLRAGKTDLARQSLDDLSKLGDSFPAQGEVAALRKDLAKP